MGATAKITNSVIGGSYGLASGYSMASPPTISSFLERSSVITKSTKIEAVAGLVRSYPFNKYLDSPRHLGATLGASNQNKKGVAPMSLTELQIKAFAPRIKAVKLFDSEGLYLEVTPTGGKWWRLKYRFNGKEKRLSLGTYPEVSLKEARVKREQMKALLRNGIDPSEARKLNKEAKAHLDACSFEAIAREWLAKNATHWSTGNAEVILSRLERDAFPYIGHRPMQEISAAEILTQLRRVENRGANETAHRILGYFRQVLRYAIITGRAERDVASDLKGALSPVTSKHFASVTEPDAVSDILRAYDGYKGSFIVKCALRLAPLVFVRPNELRKAQWSAIDLEQGIWNLQVSKVDKPLVVPLSKQAISVLSDVKPLTGEGVYVFPSARSIERPMSDNAVLSAMRRLDIPKEVMTGHGWRATARTILDEILGFRPDIIEHQLGHAVRDPNGRAYNRTTFLPERKQMMQAWADYLDELKKPKKRPHD